MRPFEISDFCRRSPPVKYLVTKWRMLKCENINTHFAPKLMALWLKKICVLVWIKLIFFILNCFQSRDSLSYYHVHLIEKKNSDSLSLPLLGWHSNEMSFYKTTIKLCSGGVLTYKAKNKKIVNEQHNSFQLCSFCESIFAVSIIAKIFYLVSA